jgi:large subunit ribosomal protein L21
MYAIIQTGGKQYRVRQGEILLVERLGPTNGAHVFGEVLVVSDGKDAIQVGAPRVEGASVAATILGETKGKKVLVFKSKKRKGYRRLRGHRQVYTKVKIDAVSLGGASA